MRNSDEGYAGLSPTINDGSFRITAGLPEASDLRIDIFNLNGQSVKTHFASNAYQFDETFSLNRGVYIVTVRHKFGVESFRTIVID